MSDLVRTFRAAVLCGFVAGAMPAIAAEPADDNEPIKLPNEYLNAADSKVWQARPEGKGAFNVDYNPNAGVLGKIIRGESLVPALYSTTDDSIHPGL